MWRLPHSDWVGKGAGWVLGESSSPEGGGHEAGSSQQWAQPRAAQVQEALDTSLRHRV